MSCRTGWIALVVLAAIMSPASAQNPQNPEPAGQPSVTVLGSKEVQSILGSEVRSAADIDFGGFLGVGSRKIAVDWKALHFVPAASSRYRIVLELTKDQVKPAPEYKEGKPTIVLGAAGNLEPLP